MKAPRVIVVGIDFSDLSKLAVDTGVTLARRFRSERVHLVHINDQSFTAEAIGEVADDWQRKMAFEKLQTITADRLNVTREVRDGIPSRDLAKVACEVNADLIIVATQGLGLIRRAVLGSVTASLLGTAHCPVLVVAEDREDLEFHTVVAGVEPGPIAKEIVEHAVEFAPRDGQVALVSVDEGSAIIDASGPHLVASEDVEKWRTKRTAEIQALVPKMGDGPAITIDSLDHARPAEAILQRAKELKADLIVVGTSGKNFWHRMVLGSTTTHVVADAKCPVLVIPRDA